MGFLKKLTKPISKFLDKIVPNEIKPALPYLSAFAPFMLPHTGIMSSMLGRGLTMGGLNIGSQLAQEGSEGEFSGLSALLAAGTGALSAADAASTIRGVDPNFVGPRVAPEGFMGTGREYLARGAEFLGPQTGGAADILGKGGTKAGFDMATLKAAALPLSQGTGDLAMADARRAQRDYEREMAEKDAEDFANDEGRRRAIRAAMEAGGHGEEAILDALASLGLRSGGIVSLRDGGQLVKRGPGRSGYAGPAGGASAGGNYGGNRNPDQTYGGGGGWSPGVGGTQHIPKKKTVVTGDGTTTPSADDIRMIQETIKEVPTKVISNQIEDLMKMGKVPQYGIGTLEEDTANLFAANYSQNAAANQLIGMDYDLLDPFQQGQINDAINTYGTTSLGTIKSKDGGRIGAEGGGIMNAKRGLVDAPGSYAGLEEIENMREFRIANPNIEDVADYKGYYERLKNPQNYDEQGFEIKEEVDFGGVKEAVGNIAEENELVASRQSDFFMLREEAIMKNDFDKIKEIEFDFFKEFGIKMPVAQNISDEAPVQMAADGGMMSVLPKGREMDYRGGGVIPMGSKERADDVPARLSKNEFVMTADAVRAAGGGSVNKGAKRMYNLMHNLEARV